MDHVLTNLLPQTKEPCSYEVVLKMWALLLLPLVSHCKKSSQQGQLHCNISICQLAQGFNTLSRSIGETKQNQKKHQPYTQLHIISDCVSGEITAKSLKYNSKADSVTRRTNWSHIYSVYSEDLEVERRSVLSEVSELLKWILVSAASRRCFRPRWSNFNLKKNISQTTQEFKMKHVWVAVER